MNRSFAPLVLCAVLALAVAPVPAAGQSSEQPPKELWDEFPLEPSATPSPVATEAPPARVVEVPADEDNGMGPGALIALMVAAAGVGAVAARLAVRQLPRAASNGRMRRAAKARDGLPKPSARAKRTPTKPRPAPIAKRTPAKPKPAPVAKPKPASAAKPKRASAAKPRPAPAAKPTPAPAETPAPAPTVEPAPAPTAKSTPAPTIEPARAPIAQPAAETKPSAATHPSPAEAPGPVESEPAASPAGKRRSGRSKKPAPAGRRKPDRAPAQKPAPLQRPPSPRVGAGRPGGRFTPGAAPRASAVPPSSPSSCSIKLSKRPPLGRFVAMSDAGDRVLARSPVFKLTRDEGEAGLRPPDALRALVAELVAAGWRESGAGRAPWDLQFERDPQGAVTHRASPPRA